MLKNIKRIRLFRSRVKLGPFVSSKDYEFVSEFVLRAVKERGTITLNQLFDLTNEFNNEEKSKLCSLLLLDVKQDLEVRGIIKVDRLPDRVQLIQLNKRSKHQQISIYTNEGSGNI